MINQISASISPPILSSETSEGGAAAVADSGTGGSNIGSASSEHVEDVELEEVQAQKSLPTPYLPTQSERMAHRITHLPYRSWCKECVEALAREMAHRAGTSEERQFPLISIDYLFLSPKGVLLREEAKNRWEEPPEGCSIVLAGMCSATKALFAFAVPRKGDDADGFAAKSLFDNISWLGHSRIAIRSDNEPAIVRLVAAAANLLRLSGVDVTIEGSVPYDPQTNGAAESAVKRVKGGLRTLQLGLENDIKARVPVSHPIISWLVRHAAMVRTMHVVGEDGKTAWQRVRGTTCKLNLVHFGEVANYKCRATEGGIGQSDDRWSTGVWLGVDPRNGHHILFDASHGGI